jgi:ABC-type multidrug transport system fused ATPase/permease subunit
VTVVIISHQLSTVKNADRLHILDEGQVIGEGSCHELRSRENGQLWEMVEMQSLQNYRPILESAKEVNWIIL